jgi:hypothetical protein
VTRDEVLRNAPLSVEGTLFPADLFVMPLAGYDVVLGTRWLGALGPIVWDLNSQRMSFHVEVHPVCWTGVSASGPVVISATMMPEPLLDTLLDSFRSVFAEPIGLPPQHAHDHRIALKGGMLPVAV